MLIKSGLSGIKSSEITSEAAYCNRREFLQKAAAASLFGGAGLPLSAVSSPLVNREGFGSIKSGNRFSVSDEEVTPLKDIARYNNFYEFGVDKSDPSKYAGELTVDPWSIVVEGEVEKPGKYNLEDFVKPHQFEERVYRLRCVEAWSMVIPWLGFPLSELIRRLQPTSRAKYVFFETLYRPSEFRGQRSAFSTIRWPYVEGLRMDEAVNPLTFLAVGLYGKALPNQNGAPIRLVVPWKYGFKSIKSIVKIEFLETRKLTSWEAIAPEEYGFYANVNPEVDHPRWSQKIERRLPSSLFNRNTRKTDMFNGYADEVSYLYSGMDLTRYY